MYKIGEWVLDKGNGKTVKIVGINDLWGYKSYNVFDPIAGTIYYVTEDKIDNVDAIGDFSIHYFKYIVASARINNELANGYCLL